MQNHPRGSVNAFAIYAAAAGLVASTTPACFASNTASGSHIQTLRCSIGLSMRMRRTWRNDIVAPLLSRASWCLAGVRGAAKLRTWGVS